jgi:hypothetical protein
MLHITQNSDRHAQTSVNLKANHPTLLQLFTKSNVFFYVPKGQFRYVYLFKELLTIYLSKSFCGILHPLCFATVDTSLLLNVSDLFHRKRILPVSGTTLSTSFDI